MKSLASVLLGPCLAIGLFVGCAGGLEGSGTGGTTGAAGTTGSAGTGQLNCGGAAGTSDKATWANVREIVQRQCGGSGCHNDTTMPMIVDDDNLYSKLTTFVSPMCGNRLLVKPCAPEESAFYLAQKGQCGAGLPQMPLGCVDTCTPDDWLEGVRQWIANGAPKQ